MFTILYPKSIDQLHSRDKSAFPTELKCPWNLVPVTTSCAEDMVKIRRMFKYRLHFVLKVWQSQMASTVTSKIDALESNMMHKWPNRLRMTISQSNLSSCWFEPRKKFGFGWVEKPHKCHSSQKVSENRLDRKNNWKEGVDAVAIPQILHHTAWCKNGNR